MSFKPKLKIKELVFSGGQKLSIHESDKILIVGPNNSGKSQTLREIISKLELETPEKRVLSDVVFEKTGSFEDLIRYLDENSHFQNYTYHIGPAQVHKGQVGSWGSSNAIYSLASMFIKNITAKDRLNICEQQNSIALGEPKTKPQHILYDDSMLMEKISNTFRKAFNKDLAFDYRGGSKLPIHLIDRNEFTEFHDRVDNEYIDKLRSYPLLDKQGDGIKGYAGILFESIAFNYDICMIDEPEAFLHPPQMRRLGQTLSEEVKGQLIVATHSSDIMRGFLEGTKGDLKIIRIHREGDKNIIHEVNQEAIKELWLKPNLKYSNALDSVFHEQVIICEDDSDCRLVNFVADYLTEKNNVIFPDTSFVPSGGKHAISGIAKILRLTGVPVKAIYDFDLLSEKNTFEVALEAFGCNKEKKDSIVNLWKQINAEVTQKIKQKNDTEIKELLLTTITETDAKKISKGMLEEIFKQKKPWSEVKKHGVGGLPNGNIRSVFKELNQELKNLGIYLVPVGEVENFSPETGLHGPAFVTKFLSEREMDDPELIPLHSFVQEVYTGKIHPIGDEPHTEELSGDKVAVEMADNGESLANNGNLCQ